MRYLLDTDHISVLQRKSGESYLRLTDRISRSNPADFTLSVISFHEQCLGANTLINRAKTATQIIVGYNLLNEILQGFAFAPVLKFDLEAANLFQGFRSEGIRIGTMDLRIASICLVNDLTLLTRNCRDFEQVPNLRLEDWTSL
jgi:tRNA(fMet)-specific endonuclease VapC